MYPIRIEESVLRRLASTIYDEVTIRWGEPDADGFYDPTLYVLRSLSPGEARSLVRGLRDLLDAASARDIQIESTLAAREARIMLETYHNYGDPVEPA